MGSTAQETASIFEHVANVAWITQLPCTVWHYALKLGRTKHHHFLEAFHAIVAQHYLAVVLLMQQPTSGAPTLPATIMLTHCALFAPCALHTHMQHWINGAHVYAILLLAGVTTLQHPTHLATCGAWSFSPQFLVSLVGNPCLLFIAGAADEQLIVIANGAPRAKGRLLANDATHHVFRTKRERQRVSALTKRGGGVGHHHSLNMNRPVPKDVVRLILRFLAHPFDARGLLGTNKFWRSAMTTHYQAVSRRELTNVFRVPIDHSFAVVKMQVKYAPAEAVVVLDVLWSHFQLLAPQRAKKKIAYFDALIPLDKIDADIKDRDAEILKKHWGVGRRSVSAVITDENWTRLMREKLVKRREKLRAQTNIEALKKDWQLVQGKYDRLKAQIDGYYAKSGGLGSWKPLDRDLRFLADYPQVYGEAKKRMLESKKVYDEAVKVKDKLIAKKLRIESKIK